MERKHFLATDDRDDADILALVAKARDLKRSRSGSGLEGRFLGLVFFDPSLRTRASFEVAMRMHGGNATVLEPGKGVWAFETRHGVRMDGGAAEHLVEAARVLGRYFDALGVRAFPAGDDWEVARRDGIVRGFAESAGVPVINLESARRHPCQGLADLMTLQQRLGDSPRGKRFVLSWAWHPRALPTAVPVSASLAAARLGMEVVIARPSGFDLDPEDLAAIETVARRCGGSVRATDDLDDALRGADAVYAKSWGSLDHFGDAAAEATLRAPLTGWRIDGRRMGLTRDGAAPFFHCLPVRRNVVVTDEVLDGRWSVVTDQAENRLHVQRAVLLDMLGGSR